MSHSLQHLLNPEQTAQHSTLPDFSIMHDAESSSSPSSSHLPPDQEITVIPPRNHVPHPHCPDTLNCLPDTNGKPQHTLPVILRCAILGAPKQRLTIREIYAAMEEKYPYYKSAGTTWKQSVRHHLSLNRLFERQPRPEADPGFGSYWTVNLLAPPGTKRPRKRGRPNKKVAAQPEEPPSAAAPTRNTRRSHVQKDGEAGPSSKPFSPIDDDDDMATDDSDDAQDEGAGQALHLPQDPNGLPFHHSFPSPFVPSPLSSGAGTSAAPFDGSETLVDRLQRDLAEYRRQSDQTINTLSLQLNHAQSEIDRLREELARAEDQLEMEAQRRRDAEDTAVGETHMRRDAQEALTTLQERWAASMRNDS